MKRLVIWCALTGILGVLAPSSGFAASPPSGQVTYQKLPKQGEKVNIDADHYFTFGFDKPPKLGAAIMKVEIFTRDGKRDTSYGVKGDADMPSMRGAHSSGDKDFSLSTKGVYLLPVQISMPGDWEIRFTFVKSGKTVFRGAYRFDL